MKKILKYSLLGLLVIFLITGFILASLMPTGVFSSTRMACACEPSDEPYDLPCNTVSGGNIHFFTVALNVGEYCSGKEIISCPASDELTYGSSGERYDITCRYGIAFSYYFFLPLSSEYNKSI
ncbi:MAG: hypothetical protein ACMXX7_00320 [Candidatus Woesearchaeota archaeon]